MELINEILQDSNLQRAIKSVKANKGAPGIDGMTVYQLEEYFRVHKGEIVSQIMQKEYQPKPVKRVYIPKSNGKMRPLGIPTVVDRVVQQAIAQVLSDVYDQTFSEFSYGFRPNRSAHMAMEKVLEYINDGCEWIVDLDIEKYFDTVNHDKLISILRERVKDARTLHLIRSFLKAGVLEDGLVSPNLEGVPQGGPLSPILSNIYLDKFDKELEQRGLRFTRYADDCNIFVKSEMSANRVMASVTSWLERKLFLRVSAEKTKVVRPTQSRFLGFTFYKSSDKWQCKPYKDRIARIYGKVRNILKRGKAVAVSLSLLFTKLNQTVRGWINYYRIGSMKNAMEEFGQWLRHKVRVVILKQWKKTHTIDRNLKKLRSYLKSSISDEEIWMAAANGKGWYKKATHPIINFLIAPKVLETKKGDRPALVNPLKYYLNPSYEL